MALGSEYRCPGALLGFRHEHHEGDINFPEFGEQAVAIRCNRSHVSFPRARCETDAVGGAIHVEVSPGRFAALRVTLELGGALSAWIRRGGDMHRLMLGEGG